MLMNDKVIGSLHPIFEKWIRTIERCSRDGQHQRGMVDSDIKVVWFDQVSNEYGKCLSIGSVKSNDALYISEDNDGEQVWCFLEFKNGGITKHDIYRKIYDSLNAIIELGVIKDLSYSRSRIEYVLIYNEEKYSKKSISKDYIDSHLFKRAGGEERLFDIEKFIGYLFFDAHTYSKHEFEEKLLSQWE